MVPTIPFGSAVSYIYCPSFRLSICVLLQEMLSLFANCMTPAPVGRTKNLGNLYDVQDAGLRLMESNKPAAAAHGEQRSALLTKVVSGLSPPGLDLELAKEIFAAMTEAVTDKEGSTVVAPPSLVNILGCTEEMSAGQLDAFLSQVLTVAGVVTADTASSPTQLRRPDSCL